MTPYIIGLLGGCSSSPSKHALWGPRKYKRALYKCRFFGRCPQNDTHSTQGDTEKQISVTLNECEESTAVDSSR